MPGSSGAAYDVIIIGAGISGLVCGSYLSRAGMKVLVVEQHDKPGGYCTSFKRRGFTFDAAAHSLGSYREGGTLQKIVAELGIDETVSITKFDPSDIVVAPDAEITFYSDPAATLHGLTRRFPAERINLERFFSYFLSLGDRTPSTLLESLKLRGKTFDFFLRSFFTDETLINTISCPVFGYVGLPPSMMQAATGTKIFRDYVLDGGYYPVGGMQKIPDALAFAIMKDNGTIVFRTAVKKIICSDNVVRGVILADDRAYFSTYVVSACDASQTFRTLLGEDLAGRSLLDKISTFTPSISTFILYLGMDGLCPGLPRPGTNVWYLPYPNLDRVYDAILSGDVAGGGGGHVLRVSPDGRTMLVFSLTAFKSRAFWNQTKEAVTQQLLSRVESAIPGIKRHMVHVDAATPNTLQRFTRNYHGANYGWAALASQSFDPDFRQKTFIKNLYLTGHWTTQTHGIPAVAALGRDTAKLIMRNKGKSYK